MRLGLSVLRVSSRDPNLRHKRTDRRLYETAADEAARRGLGDVVLRNERGHLTETSRFALFVDPGDGHWRTPRLESGLLPGVLRGLLVGFGVAHEADLTVEDLRTAALDCGGQQRARPVARHLHRPARRYRLKRAAIQA